MSATFFTINTPDGPFSVITDVVDDSHWVLASGWTAGPEALLGQIHSSLRPGSELTESHNASAEITAAVDAYYQGDLSPIRNVPVLQRSGPFRSRAWEVLRDVTPGQPVTYSDYAELTGNPAAIRAAASACASNAAALFVPCHRVIRLDGSLGGFRWGLPVKERLLERERTIVHGEEALIPPLAVTVKR